ncbi:hypothetical protein BDR04DRAFT_1232333 [Suillus decipiens]|nr:hypothetical protein BDR04DRAFT_1232333 [Suillus decipiens]
MEYSSNDVTAANSLQFTTYIYISIATFWTYDYVSSVHEELSFLRQSHWSKVKALYIVTRYIPFLIIVTILYESSIPNDSSQDKCRLVANINSALGLISVVASESFFVLRTCALWSNNRILLAAMLSSFVVSSQFIHHTIASDRCISQTFVGASVGIAFSTTATAAFATSPIPGITGCYQSSDIVELFIPFLLLFAFELALMTLTLIRAIQSWQINPSHLYIVLVKHNIFYYTCGFLFSVANIFTSLLLPYSYHAVLHSFQFIILAILATHMHRQLWHWQARRETRTFDTFIQIPMSNMSPAEYWQT